jgi:hypothetical protein
VPAFGALNRQADALYVVADGLVAANFVHIIALALAARLPTIGFNRAYAVGGALISYGPSFPDLFRRTAELVDKILRGAKPADIPVEQPTKFELALNLRLPRHSVSKSRRRYSPVPMRRSSDRLKLLVGLKAQLRRFCCHVKGIGFPEQIFGLTEQIPGPGESY